MIVIVDDTYKNRPLRVYSDYCPTLRTGGQFKVVEGDFDMEDIVVSAVNAYPDDTCRTIKANYAKISKANFESKGTWGGTGVMVTNDYENMRVRKLTPKECWRLMGFPDESFEKAAKVNSNSQLYKQAGNSIVVNVLEQIISKLGERYEEFKAE